ncbi:MAG: hypothetical protein A2941_00675 [Candidatus Yanofskybacteria bacterium RIFCSPLOWO2_01_FULL_49_17]|uniref:Uncharacterized protein n=1 Tax=Candidatus Yanofskybacteria bacterium RIFCSPLOWO2_01_FULL_49_17 TaxID=1802700 RepID=A0A1F8GTS9_9BACT|nr:MAG: hypothetical protein A2941_00675 [Candidatus Yanofskybacteria bacterium RIFCSPLOWO2_01_FULL_49_17]
MAKGASISFLRDNLGHILALTVVGVILYLPNLRNTLFWDDADWILNNPAVRALTWSNVKFLFTHDALAGIGLVSNYYRPILFLTFLGNYLVSGSSPTSYHLVSDLIHLANGLLIFYLASRWLKSSRAAFLAALIFLVHPLQTEAVTYISGRGDPLSVFLMLFGIVAYLKYQKSKNSLLLASSFLLQVLAILSRETAVLFPAYLVLALITFEYQGTLWRRIRQAILAVWPYIGISILYGLLRLTVLNFQNTLNFYNQVNVYSAHLSVRVYTFFHTLLVYFWLIIWPTGLHMDRDVPVHTSFLDYQVLLGILVIMIIALIGWRLYKNEVKFQILNFKSQTNPKYKNSKNWNLELGAWNFRIWLFGFGLFFIALGPTMGIVPINARIYEHWLYFSLAGVGLIVGFYLDKFLTLIKNKKAALLPLAVIVLVGYFGFLGVQTIRQNILWGDTEAFYQNILKYEPDDVRVLNNLGNWYSDHGRNKLARPYYERAIEVDPGQPAPYYNIGNIIRDSGDLRNAIEWYQKAISADTRFHYAYENIAAIYLSENKIAEALRVLKKLQEAAPSNVNIQRIEGLEKQL